MMSNCKRCTDLFVVVFKLEGGWEGQIQSERCSNVDIRTGKNVHSKEHIVVLKLYHLKNCNISERTRFFKIIKPQNFNLIFSKQHYPHITTHKSYNTLYHSKPYQANTTKSQYMSRI